MPLLSGLTPSVGMPSDALDALPGAEPLSDRLPLLMRRREDALRTHQTTCRSRMDGDLLPLVDAVCEASCRLRMHACVRSVTVAHVAGDGRMPLEPPLPQLPWQHARTPAPASCRSPLARGRR